MKTILCKVVREVLFTGTRQCGFIGGPRRFEYRREFLECGHNVVVLASKAEATQRKCPTCSLIGAKHQPAVRP